LGAAPTIYMAGIIPYGSYRQDPDVFYLTGISQHCVVVLQAGPSKPGSTGSSCRYMLFVEPPDYEREQWDGARLDIEAARAEFGADEAYCITELQTRLAALCQSAPVVLHDSDRTKSHMFASTSATVRASEAKVTPLRPIMHTMRMHKSPAEAAVMRASAQVSAAAIRRCMSLTQPGVPEYALAATFEYECKVRGAARMAYPQVVASGRDACTIHYGRNDKRVGPRDLILMDAGCELHGYCSDVTRTWPAGGRFSSAQRDAYEAVLAAHTACVAACKPGATIRDLHNLSVHHLSQAIKQLGLVCEDTSVEEVMHMHYRTFYWHSLGHYLGLDTHDTHMLGHDKPLGPGSVITIEPGLYIPDEPQYGHLRGIGVRIEDDVLVTQSGCEVLSKDVPVTVAEVEACVGSALAQPGRGV